MHIGWIDAGCDGCVDEQLVSCVDTADETRMQEEWSRE